MDLIKKTYIFIFLLGVFFLPFNSEVPDFMSFLGEYSSDSAPIFFLIAFIVLVIHDLLRFKISLPFSHPIYQAFFLFIIFISFAVFFNFFNISDYYFKQTSGWVRYLKQLISVLLAYFVLFYLFYNVCINLGVLKTFFIVRKTMFWSLIVVFIVGLVQLLIYSGAMSLIPLYELFDYLPFTRPTLYFELKRVNATAWRPPDLGIYVISISGFIFSYILTNKKWYRFIPFLLVIFLSIVSKSRTALVTVFLQLIFLGYFSYKNYPIFRNVCKKIMISLVCILPVVLMLKGDIIYDTISDRIESLNFADIKSDNARSNQSRFGIQYANFQVFKKYPITGIGWGQQSFESKELYPEWATKGNYEFKAFYLNEEIKSFPPGYNLYIRILAETGIIGFIIFMLFILLIFYYTYKFLNSNKHYNYIGITVFVVFFGTLLMWFQIDSFRLYVFWLGLAMLICLRKTDNLVNIKK
ncbi:O-antigen ligase family protein [Winogradskyella helgolandensis]|uniref:O-antigen ligase family protein n=1 Tax=Winogradskyella helgolandensis TaxID=2697010 RepID=UPI0015C7B4CC|nr:O-antigen ligase family protein [Winogradskyella helgolandensis]